MSAILDRRENAIRTRHRPSTPGAPFIPDLEKSAAGGVATLGESDALVPDSQLAATGSPSASTALLGNRTWGAVASAADLTAEATARAAADTAEATTRAAAVSAEASARASADALLQPLSGKNAANGYAGLDAGSKLTGSQQVYGTGANTACQGNDARLSDTRTATDNTVSTAKLQDDAVTYAKMQNVSATDKLLGRSTAGAGDPEEIACTAAGRAILDDVDAAAQRTTLSAHVAFTSGSLGSIATATPTTMFAIATAGQFYEVMAYGYGGVNFAAYALVVKSSSGVLTLLVNQSTSANFVISVSGNNVRLTQSNGSSVLCDFQYRQLGGTFA